MVFKQTKPPTTPPGMPSLFATYTGSSHSARIVVLEFFSSSGTQGALGHGSGELESVDVFRRENVVILYTRMPSGPDYKGTIREILANTPVR